jgi:hypothetical protein
MRKTHMTTVEVIKHYRADPEDPDRKTDEVSQYEFWIGSYHWYREDLDVGVLTGKMLNNGFEYSEVQPAINEISRQFAELNAPPPERSPGNAPAAKAKGKDKPAPEANDDAPASA